MSEERHDQYYCGVIDYDAARKALALANKHHCVICVEKDGGLWFDAVAEVPDFVRVAVLRNIKSICALLSRAPWEYM